MNNTIIYPSSLFTTCSSTQVAVIIIHSSSMTYFLCSEWPIMCTCSFTFTTCMIYFQLCICTTIDGTLFVVSMNYSLLIFLSFVPFCVIMSSNWYAVENGLGVRTISSNCHDWFIQRLVFSFRYFWCIAFIFCVIYQASGSSSDENTNQAPPFQEFDQDNHKSKVLIYEGSHSNKREISAIHYYGDQQSRRLWGA